MVSLFVNFDIFLFPNSLFYIFRDFDSLECSSPSPTILQTLLKALQNFEELLQKFLVGIQIVYPVFTLRSCIHQLTEPLH